MNKLSIHRAIGVLIAVAAYAASPAVAQGFPSQPLEFVAHTAAGGGTDQFARLIAEIFTREKLAPQAPQISNRVEQ